MNVTQYDILNIPNTKNNINENVLSKVNKNTAPIVIGNRLIIKINKYVIIVLSALFSIINKFILLNNKEINLLKKSNITFQLSLIIISPLINYYLYKKNLNY